MLHIYPEYKGKIKKALLSDVKDSFINSSINKLATALKINSNLEIEYVPLSKIGNNYSFWIRDPAIFLGIMRKNQ